MSDSVSTTSELEDTIRQFANLRSASSPQVANVTNVSNIREEINGEDADVELLMNEKKRLNDFTNDEFEYASESDSETDDCQVVDYDVFNSVSLDKLIETSLFSRDYITVAQDLSNLLNDNSASELVKNKLLEAFMYDLDNRLNMQRTIVDILRRLN